MAERPKRPERPQRPDRAERPTVDREAEKLKRADAKHRRRNPVENPLAGVQPTGNAEADSEAYHAAYQGSLSNRMKAEDERMQLATDAEYYIVVCFQSRGQKESFLADTGWDGYGDKYLDGFYVAAKLGVELPDVRVPYNTSSKVDKALAALVRQDLPTPSTDDPVARQLTAALGAVATALQSRCDGLSSNDKRALSKQIDRLSALV